MSTAYNRIEQEYLRWAREYAYTIGINQDPTRARRMLNNVKRMRKRIAVKAVPAWYSAALHSLQICGELRVLELTDNR